MKNTRVAGHSLRKEGAPYYLALCERCQDNAHEHGSWTDESGLRSMNKVGHGLCSCGALSPHMDGDRTRRRWHMTHKIDMKKEGT